LARPRSGCSSAVSEKSNTAEGLHHGFAVGGEMVTRAPTSNNSTSTVRPGPAGEGAPARSRPCLPCSTVLPARSFCSSFAKAICSIRAPARQSRG
jgi:hypothetical protein